VQIAAFLSCTLDRRAGFYRFLQLVPDTYVVEVVKPAVVTGGAYSFQFAQQSVLASSQGSSVRFQWGSDHTKHTAWRVTAQQTLHASLSSPSMQGADLMLWLPVRRSTASVGRRPRFTWPQQPQSRTRCCRRAPQLSALAVLA